MKRGTFRELLIKEFRQLLRDPKMKLIVLVMPIIQMLVFAFALNTDVTRIRTVLLDQDRTPQSRRLIDLFRAGDTFKIVSVADNEKEMEEMLLKGSVKAAIQIPMGFSAAIHRGEKGIVRLTGDATDSNSTGIIFNYAGEVSGMWDLQNSSGEIVPVRLESRAWYNRNLESSFHFVPGLIGIMLMVVTMLLASIAIVREKEIGTLEQIMVMPITRTEFILGKTLPYLLISYIIMTIMFSFARWVFGIECRGSFLLLYLFSGIYLAGNLGLALFISTISRTQQQALLTAFFILMPGVMLSGYLFPVQSMPGWAQILTLFNPLRWYMEIVRLVIFKAAGWEGLWRPVFFQLFLAVFFLFNAVRRFHKTLE